MIRYFIVKNEELIELVKEFDGMRKKINDAFKEFAKDNGIEANEYVQMQLLDNSIKMTITNTSIFLKKS